LIDLIAALGPSKREAAERTNRILALRYLDGVEVSAIQRELAIGRSQYYREQQRALEAVASLLGDRYGESWGVDVLPTTPTLRSRGVPKLTALVGGGIAPAPSLPMPLTSFVGREREMGQVARLLGTSRLLTLTGPPGAGKTRLALEAAVRATGAFPDGVYFVPLAPLNDPALVIPAIAQVLGIREQGTHALEANLVGALQDKTVLLVIDNLEQVVEAGPAIARLLQACPPLQALATSRIRLHVSGEQEFPVPSLEVRRAASSERQEASQSEMPLASSVALFVDRARLVTPDFQPSPENLVVIAEICAGLDGLPLAIELAAARSNLLPPQALAARLGSRLTLLTDGPRDLPTRHQTLRAAIAWSYDLLDPSEQILFEQLSVFAGGWTLEAAEEVWGGQGRAVLDSLASLVDGSLVRRELQADGEPRFAMLETIREFASEQLTSRGHEGRVRDRHAEYYLAFTERSRPFDGTPQRALGLGRINRELDNLRTALDWLVVRDPERAMRLLAAVGPFWVFHGPQAERWERLTAAVSASGPSHQTLARAQALVDLSGLDMRGGDLDSASPQLYEALAIQREVHDLRGVGRSYWMLGRIALRRRATAPEGAALIEHGLAIARAVGDKQTMTRGLTSLGQALRIAGDPAGARACWEECCDQCDRDIEGRGPDLAPALCHLAGLAVDEGDLAKARGLVDEVFGAEGPVGPAFEIARSLEVAAALAASLGTVDTAERALRLEGAAAALREAKRRPLTWYQEEEVERWLAPAHERLGEGASAAWAAGRRLSPEQAIAEALVLLTDRAP
jgi:non-specific serine/threonine protein kinase